jgi:hypothetical protein
MKCAPAHNVFQRLVEHRGQTVRWKNHWPDFRLWAHR